MKKKGFTLIELLAVIVILAVIALIATPAVLNIIEDSKKSAAEASARNIVSAAKTNYIKNSMIGESSDVINLAGNNLKYDGSKALKGKIKYSEDGKVYGKMYVSGYCVGISTDGSVSSEKKNINECETSLEPITITLNGTNFTVEKGSTIANLIEEKNNDGRMDLPDSTVGEYTYGDWDGELLVFDTKDTTLVNLKNRKLVDGDTFESSYFSYTANFSWDDIKNNNYGIIGTNPSIIDSKTSSSLMPVLYNPKDTYKDIAVATYPGSVLWIISFSADYKDVKLIDSYDKKEIINNYMLGYPKGLKVRDCDNSSCQNVRHVFTGILDSNGNKVSLNTKVSDRTVVDVIYYVENDESLTYEQAKANALNKIFGE